MDAVDWSVLVMASGSRSGTSLNSAFHLVSVVLPEPFAPEMKVSLGWITSRKVQISFAGRESPASVSSRWRPQRGLLGPSFAPVRPNSRPWVKDTS